MRLALFDLDDTLLDGDCSDRWNLWMIEQGWVSDAGAFMARAEQMHQAYHAGKLKLEEYLAMTLAPLRGRRVTDVQKEVERFVAAASGSAHCGCSGDRACVGGRAEHRARH